MILTGNWSYPTQILFGKGRIKEISDLTKTHGIKRPLFVTDTGLANQEADASKSRVQLVWNRKFRRQISTG